MSSLGTLGGARSAAMGLDGKVIFAGFRPDLERVLPCLDVVAHPATMEGMGVALLQASAAARPVVASAVGGIPEVVVDGETGLLVPPADPAALATSVGRVLDDSALAARLGENARRRVRQSFSIPAMVAGYLDLYRDLLGAAAPSTGEVT